MVLFGTEASIVEVTNKVLRQAGPRGHILNVGHGVAQGTPEEAVKLFCHLAHESGSLFGTAGTKQAVGATA
eukprot:349640-Chlamydomonas_euryale.AAC.1